MKKTFKQLCAELPSLKVLDLDTSLPKVFDMYWDAKTVRDLFHFGLTHNTKVHSELAEAGFDVQTWLKDFPTFQKMHNAFLGVYDTY